QSRRQPHDVGFVADERNDLVDDERIDGLAAASGGDVDDRAGPAHGDRFTHAADFEHDVDAGDETDRQLEVVADESLEALQLGGDAVDANAKVAEPVASLRVTDRSHL